MHVFVVLCVFLRVFVCVSVYIFVKRAIGEKTGLEHAGICVNLALLPVHAGDR